MLATLRETKHMIASLQEKEKRLKSEVSQLHEQGKLDHLVDEDDPQKFNADGLSVSLCKGRKRRVYDPAVQTEIDAKQKEIDRANRRKVRRGIFRSQKSNKDAVMLAAGGGKQKVVSARERISDDDETAERDAEKVRALALQLIQFPMPVRRVP